MIANERQQRMVERVQEDERLRGDLPDEAAVALVEWAGQRAAAAAVDSTRSDRDVEAEVQGIRAAAYAAARAGETDPRQLLALAETKLAQRRPPTESSPLSAPTPSAQQTPAPSGAEQPLSEQQPPTPRRWNPFASFLNRIRGDR